MVFDDVIFMQTVNLSITLSSTSYISKNNNKSNWKIKLLYKNKPIAFVQVNDVSVEGAPHSVAVEALQQAGNLVKLVSK